MSLATTGAGVGIWDWDVVNNKLVWDERMYLLYGVDPEKFGGAYDAWKSAVHPDDQEQATRELEGALKDNAPFNTAFRVVWPDGSIRFIRAHAYSQCDAHGKVIRLVGTNWDITDQRKAEDELRASLSEKVVLLQEVHHRVKNNLQIVSSLLNMQAGKVKDPGLRSILDDSRQRIRALTMVHERMYRGKDLGRLDLGAYLRELAEDVARVYTTGGPRIALSTDADPITCGIDTAIPCALILNESLSNAYKYAFKNHPTDTNRIVVSLKWLEKDKRIILVVSDNGEGMPQDAQTKNTLGLQLIKGLSRQVDGKLTFDTQQGTRVSIEFPLPESVQVN